MSKKKELRFISIFSVLLLVCSSLSAIYVTFSTPRVWGVNDRTIYRSFYRLQNQMEMDEKSEFDEEYCRAYLNQRYNIEDPDLAQTIFYTGDIPSIESEYVMTVHSGGEAIFIKVFRDDELSLRTQNAGSEFLSIWGEKK